MSRLFMTKDYSESSAEDTRTHGSLIHKDRESHGLVLRHCDARFVNTSFTVL